MVSRVIELEESGRAIVRPRMVDLGAVVDTALADTLSAQDSEGRDVTLDLGRRVVGSWDDAVVEEIVHNLVSNAFRFGEGRPIRVSLRATRKSARIVVEDHGRGIAPADRARIFARGARAPRRQGGGLGLGLWLVKQLARGHGGRVIVTSSRGRGATFAVTLPQRSPAEPGTFRPAAGRATADRRVGQSPPGFSSSRLLLLARHLMHATTAGELLAAARDEVQAVAGYRHVWLMVRDRHQPEDLRLIDYAGSRQRVVWATAPRLKVKGDTFLEYCVASDHPVVIEDARKDPRTNKQLVKKLENRTIIKIPLRLARQRLGFFGIGTFGDEGCRAPSARELDHFVAMAGQIAIATTRIRLVEPDGVHRRADGERIAIQRVRGGERSRKPAVAARRPV